MAVSTGYVFAAAGIVAANEAIFAPMAENKPLWVDFNWRIIPATAIAAITLAGLEKLSQPFGVGLAVLALLSVLIVPLGNAPTPVENASKLLGIKSK